MDLEEFYSKFMPRWEDLPALPHGWTFAYMGITPIKYKLPNYFCTLTAVKHVPGVATNLEEAILGVQDDTKAITDFGQSLEEVVWGILSQIEWEER
jgi:hypothetical protein